MIPEVSLQVLKQEGDMYKQTRAKLEQNLASPDKAKREKAMSLLCLWLTSQKDLKEEELTKIWKGLFYCLWHAEKAAAHVDLVERIARFMGELDVEISLLFFKVFLTTLRNELGGIDTISRGKFHLLLGQYISQMFAVLKKSEWDVEVVRKFMASLVERAFLVQDAIDANDVNVYIAGVYLHELRHYLPIPANVFKVLLEPFWVVLAKGCDERVADEISKKVFLVLFDHGSRLLTSGQGMQEGDKEGDKEGKPCFGDVALDLSFSIRTKSSAILAFTSQSKSVQLRLIEEKFKSLDRMLAQFRISTNGDNVNVINDQIETQSNADGVNGLPERTDLLQSSISPVEFPATRTFGRRSKRNQKLVFSPQTVDDVYMKVKPGISLEDMPKQISEEESSVEQGSKGGMAGECASLGKSQVDMAAPGVEHNVQTGDIIDIDGSPPNQDTLISDETDDSNMLSASEDGITMEDPVISNLAKRFESIADQPPCCEVDVSPKGTTPLAPSPLNTGGRKRKSWKSSPLPAVDSESPTSAKENNVVPLDPFHEDDITSVDNLSSKKAKKVHFSLQHNIFWKPSTPLPPHDVRVPPAATPRGSALKKGVPPGPIVDPSDVPSISPKKKKPATRKAPSTHYRSPKSLKNSAKVAKPTKKGRLSPR